MSENVIQGPFYNSGFYDTGAGGGVDVNFETLCNEFANDRDVPRVGYESADINLLSNDFDVQFLNPGYSFTPKKSSITRSFWGGVPLLYPVKDAEIEIITSINKTSKSLCITTPFPWRIEYFDGGLDNSISNTIGIEYTGDSTYTTNSTHFNNSGSKKIGLANIIADKKYTVKMTYINGVMRAEIDNIYVEAPYNYFIRDINFMGPGEGVFAVRNNSGTYDSSQHIDIYSIKARTL